MKYIGIFCLLLCLNTTNSVAQEVINASILHDNIERDYILCLPDTYDENKAYPLVFCFHGYTSSATTIMGYSRFNNLANTEEFIVVYPQGELLLGITHWNVGGWTLNSTIDDLGFTNMLLDHLIENYAINEDRVYSTGMSNGGFMSFLLACQSSERFAAIASVTGSMTIQTFAACDPTNSMPVLQIHGTADGTVPYTGNPTWTESIEDVMSYWIEHNDCDPSPVLNTFEDIAPNDGSTADQMVYINDDTGISCEHIRINGGDHDWVGVWGNRDVNATREIWRFFSQFDRSGIISSNTDLVINDDISVFPNPCMDKINVNFGDSKVINYELYKTTGELIIQSRIVDNNIKIDLSAFDPGLYLLKMGDKIEKIIKQ